MSMYVMVGNDQAIEVVDDPQTGRKVAQELPGQRVTKIVFPEGIGLDEAFRNTLGALRHHMKPNTKPAWIATNSDDLRGLLRQHYGLHHTKMKKPKSWGEDTGADVFLRED